MSLALLMVFYKLRWNISKKNKGKDINRIS